MKGQYSLEEVIRQCRQKLYELSAVLDSVEVTEDEYELAINMEDAGNYFLGVAEECDA